MPVTEVTYTSSDMVGRGGGTINNGFIELDIPLSFPRDVYVQITEFRMPFDMVLMRAGYALTFRESNGGEACIWTGSKEITSRDVFADASTLAAALGAWGAPSAGPVWVSAPANWGFATPDYQLSAALAPAAVSADTTVSLFSAVPPAGASDDGCERALAMLGLHPTDTWDITAAGGGTLVGARTPGFLSPSSYSLVGRVQGLNNRWHSTYGPIAFQAHVQTPFVGRADNVIGDVPQLVFSDKLSMARATKLASLQRVGVQLKLDCGAPCIGQSGHMGQAHQAWSASELDPPGDFLQHWTLKLAVWH